jgi:hypothetical protein
MEIPKLRDDITWRDILLFLGLILFLALWTWFVFYSGVIL